MGWDLARMGSIRLVVPRVLPAHQDSAVLLSAVHQLSQR